MHEDLMPVLMIAVMLALLVAVMLFIEGQRKPTIMPGWLDLQGFERLFIYWDAPSAKEYGEKHPRRYQRLLEAWQDLPPEEAWFHYNLSCIGVTPVGSSVRSAKRWCQKAWLKKQDVEAAYHLGMMQLMGLGGAPEYRSALILFEAAEQGSIIRATTARGLMLLRDPGFMNTGFGNSDIGDSGLVEDWPIEVPKAQRHAEALACFIGAFEQGDMLAALNLGYMLEHGLGFGSGVETRLENRLENGLEASTEAKSAANLDRAIESYLLAANAGLPAAQYRLSMLFEARGELVDAYRWAYIAAACSESDIPMARSQRLATLLDSRTLQQAQESARAAAHRIMTPRVLAMLHNLKHLRSAA
ncbi:tetratricopeptide repeat protein [Shewanella halotolerans]|uniref:tetratricopeptide repeat protein n=1 Tax=Shewanella halotolerans TaxID=2864204 RepID=UPI001C65DA0C|nr:hypothetical protein [Shewanella halotolerans]QYJ90489.1 hypothetical protein K0H81_02495 [Shewanella halotolerans]